MQNLKMAPQEPCACMSGEQKSAARQWSLVSIIAVTVLGVGAWLAMYMQLKPFAHWFSESLLGLEAGTHLGEAVAFFVYDTPKVLMLLVLVVYGVGILRSFFTPENTRRLLAGRTEFVGNVMGAALGVVTPFCSCSAVPLFVGFVTAGVPLGVTFSFLIASPMVNELALVLLYGMFGWKVAVLYAVTGLCVAIAAGWIIGRLGMEDQLQDWVRNQLSMGGGVAQGRLTPSDRVRAGLTAVHDIVSKVWLYVVAGIAIGAAIHGYVPQEFMAGLMGRSAWWSVPMAVVIGIPMYTNAAGIVPVIYALIGKGAALGTALAFMMSVVALSLPEMLMLKKVLKVRLIAVFASVVGCGILLVGYLFNILM